ncbi:MAG TPA: nucleotidyl transferase AbiEii/AbiGii toxin family protein [Vicinamibacterales bacterium]
MTRHPNLAASVAARLLSRAKVTGDDYQTLLTTYCLERFLYRLGTSDRRDRFILKGAMLLRLWSDRPYRATRDLDLLRRGDGASHAIRHDLEAIVATPVPTGADTRVLATDARCGRRGFRGRVLADPRRVSLACARGPAYECRAFEDLAAGRAVAMKTGELPTPPQPRRQSP